MSSFSHACQLPEAYDSLHWMERFNRAMASTAAPSVKFLLKKPQRRSQQQLPSYPNPTCIYASLTKGTAAASCSYTYRAFTAYTRSRAGSGSMVQWQCRSVISQWGTLTLRHHIRENRAGRKACIARSGEAHAELN